jgi:DNA ligase-1
MPMAERRALLEVIVKEVNNENLLVSPLVDFKAWADLDSLIETAREKRCEGFMLKLKESAYEVGRKKGNWWKWKVDPYSIDAVLTFAMRGHGRRANLYTDYTFGLWKDGELITFAKAYSGLSDKEFNQVDSFVRKNTVQRFGPVRQVKPELVFELAFEGIALSTRHKSGVAVRFPRMIRWRTDKKSNEANSLSDLIDLIPEDGRNQDG